MNMLKTDLPFIPDFYDTYINQVPEDADLLKALNDFGAKYLYAEEDVFLSLGELVYAPEKWTVKDILQHMIDTERVFAYRALRFSRNDKTVLSGMDQDVFAAHTTAADRQIVDLLEEFSVVRQSTILLYKSFDEEMMRREGVCFEIKSTVGAIGFTIIGHVLHHMKILKERYYPLLDR